MDAPTTTPAPPAQRPADPPEGAATPWAWQCTADGCLTVTTDGVAARIHSLQPGHVLDYARVE
jgi:hypothetical protein